MTITKTFKPTTKELFFAGLQSLGFLTNSGATKKDCIIISNPSSSLTQDELQLALESAITDLNLPLRAQVDYKPKTINPATGLPWPPSVAIFQKNLWSDNEALNFLSGGSK